jgi:hypothetical protein
MIALLCFLLTLLTSSECAAAEVSGSRPTHEWGSLVLGHAVSLGGLPLRRMYFETVDWATSNPSIKSSPWTRDAPHSGFSWLIRRMSSRRLRSILGRPALPRDFHRQ